MWTQAQIWSPGMSRHLQVVPWCSGWSQPCHFPPLPPHPSSNIRSCQPDLQLYSETTAPSSSLSSGPSITLLLSHVTGPFCGPKFYKEVSGMCLPATLSPNPQPHNPGCGIQSRELGSESGTPRSSPGTAPTCRAAQPVSTAPPPTPSHSALSCARPLAAGAQARPPAGLPAFSCLPLSERPPPAPGPPTASVLGMPTPHGSEGPSKAGALPSSCDVLVPLLSTLGRVAPAVGLKFLGLTSGAAQFTRNHAVCPPPQPPPRPHPPPLTPASSRH